MQNKLEIKQELKKTLPGFWEDPGVFYISLFAIVTETTKRMSHQFKARKQTKTHAPNNPCSGLNQTKFLSGYF